MPPRQAAAAAGLYGVKLKMTGSVLIGGTILAIGGVNMGSIAWTLKVLRKLEFEHWLFVAMLVGLIVAPWGITLVFCPHAILAYRSVDASVIVKSNLFALGWGIANVLCVICFVRIGVALTGGILSGLGVALGVTVPMVFKASGLFKQAPDLLSPPGKIVLVGVASMLFGVVLVSLAGFRRDRDLQRLQKRSGNYLSGLLMVATAGVLSTGLNFAFAYCQAPIIQAMKHEGAGDIPSTLAVWAIGMMAGALINLLYPAYIMTKKATWQALIDHWKELLFPAIGGIQFVLGIVLLGSGNLLLGVLGASVGWGIFQAMQIIGGQAVGFVSGEWQYARGTSKQLMYIAVVILLLATVILVYGNNLARA